MHERRKTNQNGGSQGDSLAVEDLLDADLASDVVGDVLISHPAAHVNDLKLQSKLLAVSSQGREGLLQKLVTLLNEVYE